MAHKIVHKDVFLAQIAGKSQCLAVLFTTLFKTFSVKISQPAAPICL